MKPTITAEADSDADLVIAARRQQAGAYGELFRRWYDRCYDVALNIVRDRETAADVAQDAFLVGWERLMDLRDPEAFGGWILRTTRNRALNRVTRDRHRTMQPIEADAEGAAVPDPDADPALHAERSDQRRLIWTAVAVLGERDSSLLDLHLRHGLEPAEIADELQITANNASQLLFRLRRKLREAIGAVLLWRDGRPACPHLATLLAQTDSFDAKVAGTIRRHQRDCDECLGEVSRQTNPERLFAAVPIAVAPLLFKERAAAALAQAGAPMSPPVAAATAVTPGPPQGAGRAIAVSAAAVVVLAAITAVLVWPSGPGSGSAAAANPPAGRPSARAAAPGGATAAPTAATPSGSAGPGDPGADPGPTGAPTTPETVPGRHAPAGNASSGAAASTGRTGSTRASGTGSASTATPVPVSSTDPGRPGPPGPPGSAGGPTPWSGLGTGAAGHCHHAWWACWSRCPWWPPDWWCCPSR